MKRSMIILFAMMALVATACSGGDDEATESPSAPPAVADPLDGTAWTLTSMQDPSGDVAIPEQQRPTIEFASGMTNGFSGCNTFRGSYEVDLSSLTFGELAATQMACEPPASDVESAYLAALGAVDSFAVQGETLTLTGGDSTLVFAVGSPDSLIGVTWVTVNLATEDAITGPVAGSEPTMEFGEDGSVTGTDGCNTYSGDYTLDGTSISVGPLATTKMACPDEETQQQSSDFATAMGSAATYRVTNAQLELKAEDGRLLVVANEKTSG